MLCVCDLGAHIVMDKVCHCQKHFTFSGMTEKMPTGLGRKQQSVSGLKVKIDSEIPDNII